MFRTAYPEYGVRVCVCVFFFFFNALLRVSEKVAVNQKGTNYI
jgi:hypothetical protein